MILELGNESARSDVLTRNEFWNSLRPDSIPGPELGQLLWLRELHLANLGLVYLPGLSNLADLILIPRLSSGKRLLFASKSA